jgi:DNA-binding transcriptional regulator YiaG
MPRPDSLPEPWHSLAEKLGGVQAFADAMFSTPRAIHQWAHGKRTPRGPARAMLEELFQRHGLTAPWAH